jgi:GT2 family glycosyltransferase
MDIATDPAASDMDALHTEVVLTHASTDPVARVRLSVCVPTYNRPGLVTRAIASIIAASSDAADRIEIVVSDNSPAVSEDASRTALAAWPGARRYVGNATNIGIAGNLNQCIATARGDYILFVGDDDRMLPGAVDAILAALDVAPTSDQVLLFGVDAVDGTGRVRRSQRFSGDTRLDPAEALRRLLVGGFAWFPGVVISREAITEAGMFDDRFGNMIDLELWVRLFARHGVRLLPAVVCAYSVHRHSATQTMPYDAGAITTVLEIFDRARATGVLRESEIDRCESTFLDQLILGGAYVRLQAGDGAGVRNVLALYDLPKVRALGVSRRWRPVRLAFRVLSWCPGPVLRPLMAVVDHLDLVRHLRARERRVARPTRG